MKKYLLIVACLFIVTGNAYGQACDKHRLMREQRQKSIEYKTVPAGAVVKGVGHYLKDTTVIVGEGIGKILTAPFKAKLHLPEMDRWRYTPPTWKWSPPRWEKLDYPDPVIPNLEIYDGPEYQYPLHFDGPVDFVDLTKFN
jgi:hypothetical protein